MAIRAIDLQIMLSKIGDAEKFQQGQQNQARVSMEQMESQEIARKEIQRRQVQESQRTEDERVERRREGGRQRGRNDDDEAGLEPAEDEAVPPGKSMARDLGYGRNIDISV